MAQNTNSTNLELDNSQYWSITNGDLTGLNFTGDRTYECWVKFETIPASGEYVSFIGKWGAGGGDVGNSYVFGYQNPSGTKQLRIDWNGSNPYLTSRGTYDVDLETGIWYHLACVVDVNVPSVKFYIDGVEHAATMSNTAATDGNPDGTAPFLIGSLNGAAWFLDGLIDEVRCWSDIRTEAEIQDNDEKELVGDEVGLVAYWKFNNDGLDETTNNNDLTNNNTCTFSEDVPFSGAAGTNFQVNIGDTFKDVSTIKINIGDTFKDVTSAKINIGDSWKDIF